MKSDSSEPSGEPAIPARGWLAAIAEEFRSRPLAYSAVAGLIVLIIVELITSRISDAVLDSQVGMIDRVLGFVFGALRGFLIVVIFYAGLLFFVPDLDTRYEWVGKSISLPQVRSTATTLSGFVNENVLPRLGAPKEKLPEG